MVKHGLDLKYGVTILDDCVEIMKIVGASESAKFYQARYWIAKGLFVSNYKAYDFTVLYRKSQAILKEIIPNLKIHVKKLVHPANEMMK